MTMWTFQLLILGLIISDYILNTISEILNRRTLKSTLPAEVSDIYEADAYEKSQSYQKECIGFSILESSFSLLLIVTVIVTGFFSKIDAFIGLYTQSSLMKGLLFFSTMIFLSQLLSLPFTIYKTFYIESKYEFNTTKLSTFILDLVKGMTLSILIGLPLLALILWFFEVFTIWGWLLAYSALLVVQLLLFFLAPTVIMPLFNKFEPLENEELKNIIMEYAKKQKFNLKNILVMDGSKRSTKSNAFFTGFGKNKRVVLFDTLIKNHSHDELLTIVAHEIGHYKRKHIPKMLMISFVSTGILFFLLGKSLQFPNLVQSIGFTENSIYASLILCSFLFQPINQILSVISSKISRNHEYEADAFAAQTTQKPTALIAALKKLSKDNMSHLTPHPFTVFLTYSHPPVHKRIKAMMP